MMTDRGLQVVLSQLVGVAQIVETAPKRLRDWYNLKGRFTSVRASSESPLMKPVKAERAYTKEQSERSKRYTKTQLED